MKKFIEILNGIGCVLLLAILAFIIIVIIPLVGRLL